MPQWFSSVLQVAGNCLQQQHYNLNYDYYYRLARYCSNSAAYIKELAIVYK